MNNQLLSLVDVQPAVCGKGSWVDLGFGDCLELMRDIPGQSIDLILADLPYGTTHNKWDSVIPLDLLWKQYKRIAKRNAAILLFGQDKFTARVMLSNESWHRYNLVWRKTEPTGFLNANRMPLRCHEDIMVFYDSLPVYHPQKTTGHPRKVSTAAHKRNSKVTTNYGGHKLHSYDSTSRYPVSVLVFKKDKQKSALHPTQKPVALLEYLIRTYSNERDVVLDNVMGVGSTGVACQNTNRNFVGMENDPKYFEIAKKRICGE